MSAPSAPSKGTGGPNSRNRWRVAVRQVPLHSILGVLEEERRQPTRILVDATLWARVGQSAQSDELQHTVDYMELVQLMERIAAASSDRLLERFAARLAQAIFARWQQVHRVRLRLVKPGILAQGTPWVECDLRRPKG